MNTQPFTKLKQVCRAVAGTRQRALESKAVKALLEAIEDKHTI